MTTAGLKTYTKALKEYSNDFIPLNRSTTPRTSSRFSNPQFNFIMNASPVVTFIFNHSSLSYEYLSENTSAVLSYSQNEFLKGGLAFGLSIVDSAHTQAVSDFIIPTLLEHIKIFSEKGELNEVNFSFNYKIKKKDGEVVWIHETMSVIEVSENGAPLLSLFHLIDITNSKKDEKIDFCVSKRGKNGHHKPFYTTSYTVQKKDISDLTDREEEVLRLISKGLSSKQIAIQLYISTNTVKAHRKNIMKKTQAENAAELINIAMGRGII